MQIGSASIENYYWLDIQTLYCLCATVHATERQKRLPYFFLHFHCHSPNIRTNLTIELHLQKKPKNRKKTKKQ